jgi:hypothetical protein
VFRGSIRCQSSVVRPSQYSRFHGNFRVRRTNLWVWGGVKMLEYACPVHIWFLCEEVVPCSSQNICWILVLKRVSRPRVDFIHVTKSSMGNDSLNFVSLTSVIQLGVPKQSFVKYVRYWGGVFPLCVAVRDSIMSFRAGWISSRLSESELIFPSLAPPFVPSLPTSLCVTRCNSNLYAVE